ncbi:unnamed protein product, partial [Allacma fusca]
MGKIIFLVEGATNSGSSSLDHHQLGKF